MEAVVVSFALFLVLWFAMRIGLKRVNKKLDNLKMLVEKHYTSYDDIKEEQEILYEELLYDGLTFSKRDDTLCTLDRELEILYEENQISKKQKDKLQKYIDSLA